MYIKDQIEEIKKLLNENYSNIVTSLFKQIKYLSYLRISLL